MIKMLRHVRQFLGFTLSICAGAVRSGDWPVAWVSAGDAEHLWRIFNAHGGAGKVILAAQRPESWPPDKRDQAAVFLLRICRRRHAQDSAWVIRQYIKAAQLLQPGRPKPGLLQAAWQLWLAEVFVPACELLQIQLGEHENNDSRDFKVAILGWYGTETLGDCAILGEILAQLHTRGHAGKQIVVFGTFPARTRISLRQLGYPAVESRHLSELHAASILPAGLETFIFGGGPLCDGRPMLQVADVLERAAAQGKKVVLWGVGIGPLEEETYKQAVRRILAAASQVTLRDTASRRQADALHLFRSDQSVDVGEDPAFGYIHRRFAGQANSPAPTRYVLFAGRPLPSNLWPDPAAHRQACVEFDDKLAQIFTEIVRRGYKIHMLPHEYWPEDDRDYYVRLCARCGNPPEICLIEPELTVDEALDIYNQAAAVLAVRFHAAVFAIALAKPFLAVDYLRGGGKTMALLADIGLQDKGMGINDLLAATAATVADRVLA